MFISSRHFISLVVVLLSVDASHAQQAKNDLYGDPLPAGVVARIGTVRLRNTGEISRVALSGDGKFLVTTASGRPLHAWDATTGAFIREIQLPLNAAEANTPERQSREQVATMMFPAGEKRLYVLTQKGTLFACDIADGTWSQPLGQSRNPGDQLRPASGQLSVDGKHLLYTVYGDEVHPTEVFAIGKDKPVYQLSVEKYGYVHALANDRILTVTKDRTLKVWDLKADKEIASQSPPTGVFFGSAISPDGKFLIAACGPKEERPIYGKPAPRGTSLYKWDLATGKELFRVPDWEGKSLTFSPDGSRVVSILGTEVLVADATTGKLTHRLRGHGAWAIFGYAFSADGKRLVTGSRDHTAIIWELTTGKPLLDFESPRGPVDVLAFSLDGKTVFAGCAEDHTGGLWDAETGKRKHWLVADGKGNPLAATFTSDGQHVVVGYGVSRSTSTGKDWTARLWSVADGKKVREFSGHTDGVHQLAVSPDNKHLATRDWGKKVRLWDLHTGKLSREFDWGEYNVPISLVFPKADELIGANSNSKNGTEVVNLLTNKSLGLLKRDHRPYKLALSPDGRKAVMSEYPNNNHPIICDVASGELLHTLTDVRVASLSILAFSADGQVVAVNADNGVSRPDTVHLFDVKTGKQLRTLRGHKGLVASIAFSPDGKRLATGSWDSTVLIWDLTTKP